MRPVGYDMISPYTAIEHDPRGIGYSPYFFCKAMVKDLYHVKVIAIDGIEVSKDSIQKSVDGQNGGYPFYSQIYAAIRTTEPENTIPHQIYD